MAGLAEIVNDPNYVSANPETKAAIFDKHAPNDPNYANANPETQAAIREKFGLTSGGAATGNPSIAAQGRKGLGLGGRNLDPLVEIGGATAIGAGLGAASKEILTGIGTGIGALPYPVARTVGGFLRGAGQVIGAGGRAAPTAAGALSGAIGETSGQAADMAFPDSTVLPELTRFVAGGIGPESVKIVPAAFKALKSPLTTAQDVMRWIQQATGKEVGPSSAQAKYIEEQVAALRGGEKTNQPLEEVGSLMGERGRNLMDFGDQQLIAAQQRAAGVKAPGQARELADIGGELQGTINTRYKGALETRSSEYKQNEERVKNLVNFKEGNGRYVSQLPEYEALVNELSAKLDSKVTNIPASQQGGYRKMVDDLRNANPDARYPDLEGGTTTLPDGTSPMSFEALDRIRRKLGEAFRGKPAEGYEAIGAAEAKELYRRVSDIQKRFAGNGQTKLLDDYADRTEGLNIFSSKYGKKATALDQYREDTFANDPTGLPSAYFKTRASVQALKELTGSQPQVNAAALEYANKQLAGKDAAGVRQWLSSNAEWLAETGPTRTLIDRYATKLEAVEKSVKNAQEFATQATKDSAMLTRQALPAQRAVDLIKSGDTELWEKAIPAIVQSTQAKTQMVNAVRQVIADQATAKATTDLFSRNIRPFIEQSNIGTRAEMDFIAEKLANIAAMNVPEAEKLGWMKRILLQAASGWSAGAAARAGDKSYQWSKEKVVPE